MGENSKIEWTDHTFNPWIGCTKVSDGCKHCYAEVMDKRQLWDDQAHWGPGARRMKTSEGYWTQPLAWDRRAKREGIRYKVFCASLADVFEDNEQVEPWREDLWHLIEQTPNLDWLLLTKRPENIFRFSPERWVLERLPRNIWFGTSAENQKTFEARWNTLDGETHHLYPAGLFLSLEPLLGPIDLELALSEIDIGDEESTYWTRSVDWVIAGGESGPQARPCHPDWVRSLRDQCQAAEVPFFFKQWGQFIHASQAVPGVHYSDGELPPEGDYFLKCARKHVAGRILDGHTWNQVPEART